MRRAVDARDARAEGGGGAGDCNASSSSTHVTSWPVPTHSAVSVASSTARGRWRGGRGVVVGGVQRVGMAWKRRVGTRGGGRVSSMVFVCVTLKRAECGRAGRRSATPIAAKKTRVRFVFLAQLESQFRCSLAGPAPRAAPPAPARPPTSRRDLRLSLPLRELPPTHRPQARPSPPPSAPTWPPKRGRGASTLTTSSGWCMKVRERGVRGR